MVYISAEQQIYYIQIYSDYLETYCNTLYNITMTQIWQKKTLLCSLTERFCNIVFYIWYTKITLSGQKMKLDEFNDLIT